MTDMNIDLLINKRTEYADYVAKCEARNARERAILNAIEDLQEQVHELFTVDEIDDAPYYRYKHSMVAVHPSSKDAKVGDYVTCIVGNVNANIKFGYSYKVKDIFGSTFVFDETTTSLPASWFVLGITPVSDIFY